MILRRVIEHVKKQHWKAIGLDFVIVVLVVFIGATVTNRKDALKRRIAADEPAPRKSPCTPHLPARSAFFFSSPA